MITQRKKHKGWLLTFDNSTQMWSLYTPMELENPVGFREKETEISDLKEAKYFIDHYNDY